MKSGCVCGATLSNSLSPNNVQSYVFTDNTMERILENDTMETIKFFEMNDYEVWLCPNCKRIYIFESDSNTYKYRFCLEEIIDK